MFEKGKKNEYGRPRNLSKCVENRRYTISTESASRKIQSIICNVHLSVHVWRPCLLVDWRLLVKEPIANIVLPLAELKKKKKRSGIFFIFSLFWEWCYYLHTLRDFVSAVWRIFPIKPGNIFKCLRDWNFCLLAGGWTNPVFCSL